MALIHLISALKGQEEPVVDCAVKNVLAHVAPMRWGRFSIAIRLGQDAAHFRNFRGCQLGKAVGAAAFVGHPVGPHVPFFKYMGSDVVLFGRRERRRVNFAGVAIDHYVCDAFFLQIIGEEVFPV